MTTAVHHPQLGSVTRYCCTLPAGRVTTAVHPQLTCVRACYVYSTHRVLVYAILVSYVSSYMYLQKKWVGQHRSWQKGKWFLQNLVLTLTWTSLLHSEHWSNVEPPLPTSKPVSWCLKVIHMCTIQCIKILTMIII